MVASISYISTSREDNDQALKNKRILWLLNHTTLREFEVPLIRSFGYEIYLPKLFPEDESNRSASVDYSYDKTLTIPTHELRILNRHDFYSDTINPQIKSILNHNFGTVILGLFPTMLDALVNTFDGKILLRVFGIYSKVSYTKVIKHVLGEEFLEKLKSMADRFWFAQAYPHLAEIESEFLKSRAITLPVGLPKTLNHLENKWIGNTNKIFFVCPRINSSPAYYGKIYNVFKEHFGDIPHTIAGAQPIPVNDPNVKGFQPRKVFDEWLISHKVMFYHSLEPRHLHYHPAEAIITGMPLIYMKEGMLGQISTNQPGACINYEEAYHKLQRILNNDQSFIAEIQCKQKELLNIFDVNQWHTNFQQLMKDISTVKTIGIFIPIAYRGGTLNAAKNMAKMLVLGSRQNNEPLKVILSCVANYYDIEEDFADLIELGVLIRETQWKEMTRQELQFALKLQNISLPLRFNQYMYPYDGVYNFNDCDFWLIISDRTKEPIAPLKPYGMVIFDYIQRYLPELFNQFFEQSYLNSARQAKFVLTTTKATQNDAINYAGVSKDKVHLLPLEFNPFSHEPGPSQITGDYFIWTTNAAPHKNHLRAIEAYNIYCNELDGRFDLVMTGVDTDLFDIENTSFQENQNPYVQKVREKIRKNKNILPRIKVLGHLGLTEFLCVLSSARFLWHPTFIDNGTYSVIEAAYYGVPSLSSRYPQMEFINDRFKLNLKFCSATSSREMAIALKAMETEYEVLSQQLPTKTYLEQFTYRKLAQQVWNLMKRLIK